MNKIITIKDFQNSPMNCLVENFQNVSKISIKVITGDEILKIAYKNTLLKEYDSSNTRVTDYFDGYYEIPINKVDEFNNLEGNSYERMNVASKWCEN